MSSNVPRWGKNTLDSGVLIPLRPLAVWPWASQKISRGLSFFIRKTGTMIRTQESWMGIKQAFC